MHPGDCPLSTWISVSISRLLARAVSAELMKTEWPELVGKTAEEAKKIIEVEKGHEVSQIQVIPSGHMVTMDFRMNRVRMFVDKAGKVKDPPRIG